MKTMNEAETTVRRGAAGRRLLAIAVLIGSTSLSACEDDPIEPREHEEGEVAAFRIDEVGGGTLYTYAGPTDPDTLFLPAGEALELEIVWLDEHGDELELDADEHSWELVENHSAIAGFTPATGHAWRGTLTTSGLTAGSTVYGGVVVRLFHGEEAEFTTPQLVAAVEG